MSKLHIVQERSIMHPFEVWLTDIDQCDGLCIGVGSTRDEALASAEEDLEIALSDLQDLLDDSGSA
jgi:hypothetical protein